MTDEEAGKYIDEWMLTSSKVTEVKSTSAQFFLWHMETIRLFKKIWQDGYEAGVKEGQQQKTSMVIKKLTEGN